MTEVLFILVTIFVAYIIYVVVNTQKATTIAHSPISQAKPEKPMAAVKQATPRPVTKNKEVPEIKPVAVAATKPEPITSLRDAEKKGLKNPKTGEVATRYSNYRFTKRWIKEALVAEKLLDKIYKNDELNADIEAKIKSAILKLEAINKYRV